MSSFWLQADIFQEFTIKEDLVGFQVNLTVLLDCLNIFGGSTVQGKDKLNMCSSFSALIRWYTYIHTSQVWLNIFIISLVWLCRSVHSLADVLQGLRLPSDPVPGGRRRSDRVQDQHTRTRRACWFWFLQQQRHKQGELYHSCYFILWKRCTYIDKSNSWEVECKTHAHLALFKGDPAVRESEGSLLRTGHDQWGAADHHVPQPAIL